MPYTLLIVVSILVFLTCLVILNFDKIKQFFSNLKIFKKPKKEKKSNGKSNKLKPVETQFRPVLKPPEEHKLLNEPKKQEQSQQVVATNEENFGGLNLKGAPVTLSQPKPAEFSNMFSSNNRKFKTQEELDKEFDDIKNFLNLPINNKKPETKKGFFTIDNKNNDNLLLNKNSIKTNFNEDDDDFDFDISNLKAKNSEKKHVDDKYENILGANKNTRNIIKVDGDDIDLNKLPYKIRSLLIANILNRKNFD